MYICTQKSNIKPLNITTMAEDKKNQIEEQLNDEQLNMVSGGSKYNGGPKGTGSKSKRKGK